MSNESIAVSPSLHGKNVLAENPRSLGWKSALQSGNQFCSYGSEVLNLPAPEPAGVVAGHYNRSCNIISGAPAKTLPWERNTRAELP